VRDFRKLAVWEKSHQLALAVYEATVAFPRDEVYALTSQIRRAATSIPSNIAEGCGRSGEAEFRNYLRIAAGSASELEYQLLLVHDLKYLDHTEYERLSAGVVEVKRMLARLLNVVSLKGDV
jgi:four helix bundle protein